MALISDALDVIARRVGEAHLIDDNDNLPAGSGEPDVRDGWDGDGPRGSDLDRICARLALTDLGNAERFLQRFGPDFIYCPRIGGADGWFAWDGVRWQRDGADKLVKQAVHDTIRLIKSEAWAIRDTDQDKQLGESKGKAVMLSDQILSWAATSQSAGHIGCIAGLAAPYLEKQTGELDADPYKINVLNGTIVVRPRSSDGDQIEFRCHERADLITKLSPVVYDPNSVCPHYDKFLSVIQPDGNVRRLLHQWAGLSWTGDATEQKLLFFYGKGKNGKSTLVDAWAHAIGEYSDTVPIETFLDQGRARRGGDASPDLAGIVGVRFLRTSEPEKGAKLAEALIKLATGGEPIKARHLNRDFFTYKPQFKLTISGNYRPKVDGTDDGIWRRVVLVPFAVTISAEERDKALGEKLAAEGSGILNRLLDGLRDWLENGLQPPEAVTEATERYRSDSDPLGRFLDLCVLQTKGSRVQSSEMHKLFIAWAKALGEREWSAKGLAAALKERGFVSKQSNLMWWLDCTLTKSLADFGSGDAQAAEGSDDG